MCVLQNLNDVTYGNRGSKRNEFIVKAGGRAASGGATVKKNQQHDTLNRSDERKLDSSSKAASLANYENTSSPLRRRAICKRPR